MSHLIFWVGRQPGDPSTASGLGAGSFGLALLVATALSPRSAGAQIFGSDPEGLKQTDNLIKKAEEVVKEARLSESSLRISESLDVNTVLREVVESARALTSAGRAGLAAPRSPLSARRLASTPHPGWTAGDTVPPRHAAGSMQQPDSSRTPVSPAPIIPFVVRNHKTVAINSINVTLPPRT